MIRLFSLKPWTAVIVLLLMALGVKPQAVLAADGKFDTPSQAFSWYSKGPGCIHLKLMTTNASPYRTLHSATYGVRDSTGRKTPVFYVGETSSTNSGYVVSDFRNLLDDDVALLYLTNDTKWTPLCWISDDGNQEHHHTRTNKEDGYAELDWYYPASFAGKTLTFYVEATLWREGGATVTYSRDIGTMEFDDIMLDVYDAIPGTDAADAGVLRVPVASDHVINWIEAKYKDGDGQWKTLPRTQLEKNAYSGFIRIPACEAHDSLTVTANVVSATVTKSDIPNSDWPSAVSGNLTKTVGSVPMIHNPRLLIADVMEEGSIKLQWKVSDKDRADMFDGDVFQVQRSLTGRLEDFKDIGSVMYEADSLTYSFEDTKLISSLQADQIDKKNCVPLVRYRVFRTIANELWGADHNPTMVYVQPSFATLTLLTPEKTASKWVNEDEKKVEVTWDYMMEGNMNARTFVWDSRAEMRVEIKMRNAAGYPVDSVARVLTLQEIKDRRVELTLNHSCVKYDLRMRVDPKDSPVSHPTGDLFVIIRNHDDFVDFMNRVYNGETSLNAILCATLDAKSITIAAEEDRPYTGNFNGNGNTIWVDYNMNSNTAGLFRNISNGAVITNLTTKGTIKTAYKFAGGLVGHLAGGTAFIENCVSDVIIKGSIDGDGSHGGLVGLVNGQSTMFINNSLYTGALESETKKVNGENVYKTKNWGGFVGYRGGYSFVMLSNNYFHPTDVSQLNPAGSATFMRNYNNDPLWGIVQDCYYQADSGLGIQQGRPSESGPSNWCWQASDWEGNRPIVNKTSFNIPQGEHFLTIPTINDYYYENTGKVIENSLRTQTQQSSVYLRWQTDEGDIDYFEVWRRTTEPGSKWERIATQVTDLEYEDNTVSPVFDYLYRVSSNNDCEGKKVTYTNEVLGNCVKTGKVEGYVRFADGTGIPGVTVTASQYGDGADAAKGGRCTTDESGFFSIEGLDYWGYQKGDYQLTLSGVSANDLSEDCKYGIPVTFDHKSNYEKNCIFTLTNGVKFSGLVMYRGTSIPVHGAHFLVDGHEVRSASGPVESDFEGKFSFRMLKGNNHTVQAVLEGHTFYKGGYYYKNNDTNVYFDVDVANTYFYDETSVKLIGRVAGGEDQGRLPLGNSLSRNNLGDNLKMVLTLEGDNASWLVFDNVNRTVTEKDTTYIHNKTGVKDKNEYKTRVHTTRHRMEVWPDSLTGEYQVLLPPVKWKIQQISAEGYATLFQDGKISDVIDLTDSLTKHTDVFEGLWKNAANEEVRRVEVQYYAQYNRIYRSPVLLERKQRVYDKFDYFGETSYNLRTLMGDTKVIPIAFPVTEKNSVTGKERTTTGYTFGYPVFSLDRGYNIMLSAVERYYYNNNVHSDTVDVVHLDGGFVTIRNGLISGTHRDTLSLDSNGEAVYTLRAAQRPYIQTGEEALYTVNFSMERDGVTYEAEPLKGYVFSQYSKPGAKDIISINRPVLVDILRDPPGGGSSAKLSKGSTLKLAYQMDMAWSAGLSIGLGAGGGMNAYSGIVTPMGGPEWGVNYTTSSVFNTSFDIIFSGTGQRAFSYTMTANEDISTDAGITMVGADADIYMGMETNLFLRPTVSVQALNDSVFKTMGGLKEAGRMVEIAEGRDAQGKLYHLVRNEAIGYGQRINSTFVHSQQYIVKQLMPKLAQECEALMFTGSQAEAEKLANQLNEPVYLSLITDTSSPRFAVVNTTPDDKQEYVYNSTNPDHLYADQTKMNYLIVLPNGYDDSAMEDKVYDITNTMYTWASMIARNEKEKMEADELMKNFEMDGGGSISYSEDFSTEYSNTSTYNWLLTDLTHDYFEEPNATDSEKQEQELANRWATLASIVGPTVGKMLAGVLKGTTGKVESYSQPAGKTNVPDPLKKIDLFFVGTKMSFSFTPVISYKLTPKLSESEKYNRKESFTIKMDKKSHLDFDVYRVKVLDSRDSTEVDGRTDVFVEENFLNSKEYVKHFIDRGVGSRDISKYFTEPRSFVYRTRGGATVRPWENERKTVFYRPGSVLDERTKKIENPLIKMDRQSISGVPIDEPARFKIYMTNESEAPEAIGGALQFFTLYLDETTNPKGARLMIDGMPLSRSGMTIKAVPGEVTEKMMEVWAAEDFDYDNLKIGLISQGDVQCVQEVAFSVHFLRSAGNVEIATPGDKWIMNTDAPFDAKRGWYMPVIISGFNKNQKNFDHIEFQYKESTRGDDYWTNLCAFYADSTLYRAATGTHEMIPENGNIVTKFYGEGTVMEKAYDLRARLYCRNGNSFITSDSKVLSGIKDTRRPQLFGSPDPKDGIIGAGDNIVFNFSEAIEHNYLQQATNFEVVGETNEDALSEEIALLFTGDGYAETDARRNFTNKNMTIDLMVRPEDKGIDMPLFSHGIDGHRLQLWLTKDWHLRAVIDDSSFVSTKTLSKGKLQQVALILDNDHKQALLYNDSIIGSMDKVIYSGYGSLIFGATNEVDVDDRWKYSGRMLEARIWNRAMTESLLNIYGKRQLTGYEMGLADYYPMNDGESDYAIDKAQGANAELHGATWALPRGMSLSLDWSEEKPVKGMQLSKKLMARSAEEDYTLMFWFKTNNSGKGALLSNGSGRKTDDDAKNRFFVGFEGDQLKYRSNGNEVLLGKGYADNEWHHFALTVDRSHKLANIWVDRVLRHSMPTDTLGGMAGSDFYVGNMVWHEAGSNVQTLHSENALTGHIDELCLFAQALPPSLLKRYSTKSPSGLEKGLLVYLGFNRQERVENNDIELKPFALNQLVKRDMDGNPTNQHDTVFVEPVSYVLQHIDQNYGAPVQANKDLRNLNFSFVGRDNQLLVNIDELNARINKRNLYVTVTDIPDLNGNYMASPSTVEFFVDRNPLRWERKSWEETIWVRSGEDYTFDVKISNTSGATHQYTVENLPRWLTVNKQTDIIDPKGELTLRFSVNKDLNVGTYDEVIYLTDEDELSEPMSLTIRKEGDIPSWYVAYDLKHYSMNVVGMVKINDAIVTDEQDRVAAFDNQGRCMGMAFVSYNPNTAESQLYMTVFDSTAVGNKELHFKLWHHQTGQIMMLENDRTVKFSPSSVVGSVDDPVVMTAGSLYYQQIALRYGWNWISFNVDNDIYRNPEELLKGFKWSNGDIVTDDTEDFTFIYNKEMDKWLSNKKGGKDMDLSTKRSYRLFLHDYFEAEIPGYPLKDEAQRTIFVKHDWNNIGYTPMVNLPVSTAMADYVGVACDKDVLKSREEFAVFTETAHGAGYWSGSLQYMKPGEGYMLYRNSDESASFRYPFYEPGSTFFEGTVAQSRVEPIYANTMTLAASVDGVELQPDDRLLAFSDGELRGEAQAIDSVFYVSIAGDKKAPLSFAIEREGEIIATTTEVMVYEKNAVSGSPTQPTAISFVREDLPQHGWFSVEGYQLQRKPTRRGVYIYNGKKQVVK
ncbi:MAG: hypothetical protein J5552_08750 [Prevotella sp.]|nr:hypothetical protein [Prevotella sp.]